MSRSDADITEMRQLQLSMQKSMMKPWQITSDSYALFKSPVNGTVAQRMDIYIQAFHARLVSCMENEFPVLRLALGSELFVQFVHQYLNQYPPDSYTLMDLGKRFPQFLRESKPEDQNELWPEFILELAEFERKFSEIFHCDESVPSAHAADNQSSTQCSMVLECYFPVDEYYRQARQYLSQLDQTGDSTVQKNLAEPDIPAPSATKLLLYRENNDVRVRKV